MDPQATSLHLEEPQWLGSGLGAQGSGLGARGSGLSIAVTELRPLVRIGGVDSS